MTHLQTSNGGGGSASGTVNCGEGGGGGILTTLAFDRESVREKDKDGRLRVAETNISKADVNPYLGHEIPGWSELGLEANKVYHLLRDPDELAKAAESFNGLPLLRKHVAVSAQDHKPGEVVGATGTDASFDFPFLKNSLMVWDGDAISDIESELKKELSCGYHYRPEMTPGVFDGKHYDGIMRDIRGNHVALVKDGRAGSDVVVGDSKENLMTAKATRLGALALSLTAAHVAQLLAMDAKIELPKDLFAAITSKNLKEKKADLLKGVRLALDGKLRKGMALDASTEGLSKLLDALEETAEGADESASEEQHKAMEAAAHGESTLGIPKKVGEEFASADKGKTFDAEPVMKFLREKGLSEDDIGAISEMLPKETAMDEKDDEAEKKKREDEEKTKAKEAEDRKQAKDNEMKDVVTKPAMDAAINAAVQATEKRMSERAVDIRRAEAKVRPLVGELSGTLAFDSGAAVYRHALKMLGQQNVDAIHESALETILDLMPKRTTQREQTVIATDAKSVKSLNDMFPGIDKIGVAA